MSADRLDLAADLLRLRRYDEVEAEARIVLAAEPERVDALVLLGEALLGQNEGAAALEVLEQAAGLAPERVDVLIALARAQSTLGGKLVEAERTLGVVLTMRPGNPSALWLLCQLRMRQRRRTAVYDTLGELANNTNDATFVHEAVARVALWDGHKVIAARHLERCLSIRPDDPELLWRLAQAGDRSRRGLSRRFDPLLRTLRSDPTNWRAAGHMERVAHGRLAAVAGIGAVSYAGLAVLVEAALGVTGLIAVRVADVLLLLAAYQAIRVRSGYELPPEAIALVERRRRVQLWPFALALGLGELACATAGTRLTALIGAVVASQGASHLVLPGWNRSPRTAAVPLAAGLAGLGMSGGAAYFSWQHATGGARVILIASVVAAITGMAGACYRALRPKPDSLPVRRPSIAPRTGRLALAIAFAPWWLLLGSIAVPLVASLWPLLLVSKARATGLGPRVQAFAAGCGFLLTGLLGAALILGLGGRNDLPWALIASVTLAAMGMRLGWEVWVKRVPDWIRLMNYEGSGQKGSSIALPSSRHKPNG